jgi:hypothetical protein
LSEKREGSVANGYKWRRDISVYFFKPINDEQLGGKERHNMAVKDYFSR